MTAAYFAGFRLGLGLIVAIGAQNAFVLRQGLLRRHVFLTCAFCALADALLIALGVGGFALASGAMAWLAPALRWGGVAFLLWYGLRSARSAWQGGGRLEAATAGEGAGGIGALLATLTLFTFANPHVWLDTVVLLGSISAQFAGREPAFAAGAMTASCVFFFSLGYGARLLAPLFARPAAWRVLDGMIALVMWSIALGLALGG
ncbi:LysE/ArgO family amino acid transporter [Frigidibacter oleivorans]|uniref:LysE/ArgO family amino acid transporter n=1 Tax=Frigidibacter oleivorans TaxID=2487129 RepID=UPI000F8D3BB6|nr:LysE/ArgO family amino acid transporter [Frigidibacter oleivorans]